MEVQRLSRMLESREAEAAGTGERARLLESELEAVRRDVEARDDTIRRLGERIEALAAEHDRGREEFLGAGADTEKLRGLLAERDAAIETRESDLQQLRATIDEGTAALMERDQKLEAFDAAATAAGEAEASLQRQVHACEQEISRLRRELLTRDRKLGSLQRDQGDTRESEAEVEPERGPATEALPEAEPDNLQEIKGIGPKIHRTLNQNGVTTFREISHWGRADVKRLAELLHFPRRISKERWVQQARTLHRRKYGEKP